MHIKSSHKQTAKYITHYMQKSLIWQDYKCPAASCGHWTNQSEPYSTVLRCLVRSPAVINSVLRWSAVVCGVLRCPAVFRRTRYSDVQGWRSPVVFTVATRRKNDDYLRESGYVFVPVLWHFVHRIVTQNFLCLRPSPISVAEALCFQVVCPWVHPSVRPHVRSARTISWNLMDGISPNFRSWWCNWGADELLRFWRSRGQGQGHSEVIYLRVVAAGGGIHIDVWASKYHLVYKPFGRPWG